MRLTGLFKIEDSTLKIDDTLFYEEMFAGSFGQVNTNSENYNTNSGKLQVVIPFC